MNSPNPITLIIAEDHEVTRLGLKILLEHTPGFRVLAEAADGQTAVAKVVELQPAVVLMDVGLPGLDGVQATREIKKRAPGVRVVMFTSHAGDDDIFAAFSAGADAYCLKETPTSNLLMAISSVASGAAWLDPGIANRVLSVYSQGMARPGPAAAEVATGQGTAAPALSDRDLEVLRLVIEGLGNQAIAERLYLSVETVKSHMRHIMEKLSVADRTQAAVKALREGII